MDEHSSGLYFDFDRAYIVDWEITETEIRVTLEDFGVIGGYPAIPQYTFFASCVLVYEDVTSSKRIVRDYLDENRQTFGARHEYVDGPFQPSQKRMYLHSIDAVSKTLNAYIGWDIVAVSVRIEAGQQLNADQQ